MQLSPRDIIDTDHARNNLILILSFPSGKPDSSFAMKVDLWHLFYRFFIMAAAANFLYNLMPYVMLFLPDARDNQTEPPSGHFTPMVHEPFSEERRIQMKNEARKMFYWGYDNYMLHAFPYDELNPINCSGRGHDWEKP